MSDPSQEAATDRRARLRRSARLSAVQALYQMETSGSGAKAVVKEFRDHRFGYEDEPGDYVETDEDFFEDLVTGIVSIQADVDKRIGGVLKAGNYLVWTPPCAPFCGLAGMSSLHARMSRPPSSSTNMSMWRTPSLRIQSPVS